MIDSGMVWAMSGYLDRITAERDAALLAVTRLEAELAAQRELTALATEHWRMAEAEITRLAEVARVIRAQQKEDWERAEAAEAQALAYAADLRTERERCKWLIEAGIAMFVALTHVEKGEHVDTQGVLVPWTWALSTKEGVTDTRQTLAAEKNAAAAVRHYPVCDATRGTDA